MDSIQASQTKALFSVLRQSADGDAVTAIEALVREAPDRALNRVNILDFAVKNRLSPLVVGRIFSFSRSSELVP
ncbi:MAG TPA: DUF5939 domain-containing protein [Chthoniobacterales bacterium]|nr:DUF5939 domain-containing protein [Chthoniobacterales bacterium]